MENLYDVIIIGGGPAGLTAAIYLARAKYRVLVAEKKEFGGQITITSEVVNYPGVMKISGKDLTDNMRAQAQNFGAEFMIADVLGLDVSDKIKTVKTDKGDLKAFGILIATGAHPRMIGFDGEAEFKGHGVAYCATCDGEFFTGKEIFVVGGGYAAAEEAVFLTRYGKHVTILVREDDFTCAKAVADKAKECDKITVLTNTEVVKVQGDSFLNYIKYKDNKTGEETEYSDENGFGVFVFAGYEPASSLVRGIVKLDDNGYIITDSNKKTNVSGVYAAGDICEKNLRQVVTATGDGAIAATELERYAKMMQEETGIHPKPLVSKAPSKEEVTATSTLFTSDMISQLNTVFERMENKLRLKIHINDSKTSLELKSYMEELIRLTDKLSLEVINEDGDDIPYVSVFRDDKECGMRFHGVPGGHEFTSFVLGLYNMAGSGQKISDSDEMRIRKINKKIHFLIMVSLSCTMCPELVTSALKIASMNENVDVDIYELSKFDALKNKYNVMSVPCMVINDGKPLFGKKNINELLDIIDNL